MELMEIVLLNKKTKSSILNDIKKKDRVKNLQEIEISVGRIIERIIQEGEASWN